MKFFWGALLAVALLDTSGIPAQAQTPDQNFAWTVTGTGTETWFTDDMVYQSKTISVSMPYDTSTGYVVGCDSAFWTITAPISGTATFQYALNFASYPAGSGGGSANVYIRDQTTGTDIFFDETSNSGTVHNGSFPVIAGHTYVFTAHACGTKETINIRFHGFGSSQITAQMPDHYQHNSHTATRTASQSGNNLVNAANGEKNLGGFYAPPQTQNGGTLSGVTYSVYCTNPNVTIFFSDTRTQTTTNPNASVIAVTSGAYGGTPQTIPGSVRLERYDTGGEGIAYHDTTSGNSASPTFRSSEGVDISYDSATDTASLGWTQVGEWIKYSVNVQTEGYYNFVLRVACPTAGGTGHIEIDGNNATGPMTIPNTGGWNTFQTVSVSGVHVTSGFHILRFVEDSLGAGNFGVVSTLNVVLAPPTLQGLSVTATNSTSVVFQVSPGLSTNFSVGGYYVGGGATNNFGTGPGPSMWEISGLKPNTAYAFSFYQRDLVNNLSGSTVTVNVTTLPVPTLQGFSVVSVTPTNVIFQIQPALSTNYSVGGNYIGGGVTNSFGTGPGPAGMGFGSLKPNTTYAFSFYQHDLVNNLNSSTVTTNVSTLPMPGYNQVAAKPLGGGKVQLSFVGNAGAKYALERSASLSPAYWVPQTTNIADSIGVLAFTNTPNATTNNFWRIRLVP